MTMMATANQKVQEGLDFILSHFNEPHFPRTISTAATSNAQVLVYDKEKSLARFQQANYSDCRISAYPPNADENPSAVARFQGIRTATPANFIVMIDFDRCNFKSERASNLALNATLKNIKEKLAVDSSTVLWSGRGYHIIQPLDANGIILEHIQQFENVQQPSLKFLRFTEQFLSNGKCDLQHNNTVSFRNCMLRIPGSINSKNGNTIRILQRWNGYRPQINYVLRDFRRYLIDQRVQQLKGQQMHSKNGCSLTHRNQGGNRIIYWIERLLHTPINDYRKLVVWRILSPYLRNIRGLSYDESYNIIRAWLDKCNQVERLTFNANQKIKESLRGASHGYLPISLGRLEIENIGLYSLTKTNLDYHSDEVKERHGRFD